MSLHPPSPYVCPKSTRELEGGLFCHKSGRSVVSGKVRREERVVRGRMRRGRHRRVKNVEGLIEYLETVPTTPFPVEEVISPDVFESEGSVTPFTIGVRCPFPLGLGVRRTSIDLRLSLLVDSVRVSRGVRRKGKFTRETMILRLDRVGVTVVGRVTKGFSGRVRFTTPMEREFPYRRTSNVTSFS